MKQFELPTIEIERFALVDTIADSVTDMTESPGNNSGNNPINLPEDGFDSAVGFYKRVQ